MTRVKLYNSFTGHVETIWESHEESGTLDVAQEYADQMALFDHATEHVYYATEDEL